MAFPRAAAVTTARGKGEEDGDDAGRKRRERGEGRDTPSVLPAVSLGNAIRPASILKMP